MRLFLVSLLLVICSACGFHLRGSVSVPAQYAPVFVEYANQALGQVLQSLLNQQGFAAEDATKAKSTIVLGSTTWQKRILTMDASGQPIQYELKLNALYSIQNTDKQMLLDSENIVLSRDYSFSSDQLLASDSEIQRIKDELLLQAAQQVLRRLSFL
ncbi:MAG: LPS assembly lipoprotein LptE [Gammaproteobacteria bacterium]|nr:LPS assembly lipoprotein LptE [Gammaproteobacteria bacterium]